MHDADELQRRLLDVQHADPAALDQAAYDRIVQQVVRLGPAQVRRSSRQRSLLRASAVALPLALAGGWLGLRELGVLRPDARTPASSAVARSGPTLPACAGRTAPSATASQRPDQTRLLDLGEVGQIVLAAGSEATLDSANPCRLQLQLERGRASVHAANLFGGELRVRTATAEVLVHGTTFAVEQLQGETLVDVDSGLVSVKRAGQRAPQLVRPGERLQLKAALAPVVVPLGEDVRHRLRASFDRPLEQHEPAPEGHARRGLRGASDTPLEQRELASAQDVRRRLQPASNLPREQREPALAEDVRREDRTWQGVPPTAAQDMPRRPRAPLGVATEQHDSPAAQAASAMPPRAAEAIALAPAASRAGSQRATQPTAAGGSIRAASATALVARADAQWQDGARDEARASYRAAGALSGPTAEAAWLALARKELAIGRASAARAALASYARRFPDGTLSGEAAGIEFRAAREAGDLAGAERVARHLLERHAATPQAEAAERWLRARETDP